MFRRLRGPGPDDVREIERDIVIGRTEGDIQVDDQEVSRRHAVIRPVPEGVEVEDLGSSNGTFVDGTKVEGKRTVAQNATVSVGGTDLRLEIELPQVTRVRQAPIPRPDVTVQRPVAGAPPAARGAAPRPPPPPPPPPPAPP